jgi:MFS family permease
LDPTARRLIGLRLARSFGQGALVVDLALYLKALGWSAVAIGAVLGITGLVAATLSLAVGIASDRLGRKGFLIASEALMIVCAAPAFWTAIPWLLVPAIVLAGLGRGMNGSAGFFSPAEQSWMARVVGRSDRGRVYSLNLAAGSLGMAAGAGLAALPDVLAPSLGLLMAFRLLFLIPIVASGINLFSLTRMHEAPDEAASAPAPPKRSGLRRRENRLLATLVGLNATNGFAVGLIAPLLSYWFSLRFGLGPAAIAPFFAATFVVGGLAALATGRLSERIGVVPAVVSVRSLSVLILVLVPLMPMYAFAAALYALRSALNRGSVGARQALVVSLVGDERRGLAVSLGTSSFQYAQSVGPVVTGLLIELGALMAPFFAAAGLQLLYAIGFWYAFRRHDPSRPSSH